MASYGYPSTVIGNTNQDIVQTLAMMNSGGDEINREHQWQGATKEYRFTTQYLTTTGTWTASAATVTAIPSTAALAANTWQVANSNGIPNDTFINSVDSATQVTLSQTPTSAGTAAAITFAQLKYSLPSDYDRPIDRTDWDKTKHWEMIGPVTAQQWQWLKSGYISTGPRINYRLMGNYFEIWPLQASNEYLGFEYQSKNWVLATAGTAVSKQGFAVDTDTCIFPDPLMRALIKLKYYEAKNFDTTSAYREYTKQLDLAKAHDAGSATLSMAPRMGSVLIGPDNIPDSGYGR